jgi:hypothetical protein
MPNLIAGAMIGILADLGTSPFLLDVHELDRDDSLLTPAEDATEDISDDVLHASWEWGASRWAGPRTMPEAGKATAVIVDPNRVYDPTNDASPAILRPGARIQITVDDEPAWTGYLSDVSHAMYLGQTTITAEDGIARAARMVYGGSLAPGSTVDQLGQLLDAVGWPAADRIVYGAPAAGRNATDPVSNVLAELVRLAICEVGDVWCDRLGRIAFRCRDGAPEQTIPVVGLGGAHLDDALGTISKDGIVNHVILEPMSVDAPATPGPVREWSDPGSIARHGRRSWRGRQDDLQLATT